MLPAFIIVGAQKGGTSSLYHHLAAHPAVGAALTKEVKFFDRWYDQGLDWYRACFPLVGEADVTGEASPSYLGNPLVPERIARALPEVRLISMLRNPVDRAFSQYRMQARRGHERLGPEEAILAELERVQAEGPPTTRWRRETYCARGLYAEQLERWLAVFPRERLLILRSEDFFARPEACFHDVLDFLGLPTCSLPDYPVRQQGSYDDPIPPRLRERLAAFFAPHNERLYRLIGRDLEWERG